MLILTNTKAGAWLAVQSESAARQDARAKAIENAVNGVGAEAEKEERA